MSRAFDAAKHGALPLVADARSGLDALDAALRALEGAAGLDGAGGQARPRAWNRAVDRATRPAKGLPTDAQVLGAVNRVAGPRSIVVCAAGGLPGELHKLWRATDSVSYHLEYGYSCMGYEIAGGLGAKLAAPDRDVYVLVGDGSYLMMNSEIATAVAMGAKLTIVVLDNRGFGCINRLQRATGGAAFNNLLGTDAPAVDFAAHAKEPRRRRRKGRQPRRARNGARPRQTHEEHACGGHRHRSGERHRGGRRLVGCRGDRGAAQRRRARTARRGYERARRKQRLGA